MLITIAAAALAYATSPEERYIFDDYRRDLLKRARTAEQPAATEPVPAGNSTTTLPKSAPLESTCCLLDTASKVPVPPCTWTVSVRHLLALNSHSQS